MHVISNKKFCDWYHEPSYYFVSFIFVCFFLTDKSMNEIRMSRCEWIFNQKCCTLRKKVYKSHIGNVVKRRRRSKKLKEWAVSRIRLWSLKQQFTRIFSTLNYMRRFKCACLYAVNFMFSLSLLFEIISHSLVSMLFIWILICYFMSLYQFPFNKMCSCI